MSPDPIIYSASFAAYFKIISSCPWPCARWAGTGDKQLQWKGQRQRDHDSGPWATSHGWYKGD